MQYEIRETIGKQISRKHFTNFHRRRLEGLAECCLPEIPEAHQTFQLLLQQMGYTC